MTPPEQRPRGTVLIANPGADLYGSDRMAVESAAALVEAGYRVVVTVPRLGPLVAALEQLGAEVSVLDVPVIRKSSLRPTGFVRLIRDCVAAIAPMVRLIRATKPSAILINTITAPLWFPLARLLRIPVIGHVHEAEASAPRPIRIALALPLLFARRLIVNSEFSLGVVTGALPLLQRRSVVVYNAVAGPEQVAAAREDLDATIRLLFVGRLSARKGPDIAVRAVAVLRDRGVDAELTLAGAVFEGYEWFERQLHEDIATAGLQDQVIFLGFQPDRWPATAETDIVLVPSTVDEPFGNVAVEAGLAARPQVVSGISGLREAADGIASAIRVPASDPEAIADAVERIAADWPRYRADALTDAAQLAERYSHRGYGDQIIEVVEQVRRPR